MKNVENAAKSNTMMENDGQPNTRETKQAECVTIFRVLEQRFKRTLV